MVVKYIATTGQRQKILAIQHKKSEEKIMASGVYKNKIEEETTTIPKMQISDLVEVKNIKWYEKVYLFFKRIFRKEK